MRYLVLKDGQIAANCDLEEERKANRKFIELETRGGNREGFVQAISGLGLRIRPLRRTPHKADHAGVSRDK